MKIVELIVENFKKVKAISIKPTGNIVLITGANEQGKSSLLDAIWAVLENVTMGKSTGTVRPIREGQKSAKASLDLGDIIVSRKWSVEKSTVEIEGKDGQTVYRKPQEILDGLMGKIALDPLSFATMDNKKQKEMLVKLANLPIDLDKIKQYRDGVFAKRTDVNRAIKYLEGQIVGLPEIPEDTPDEELLSSAILVEQQAAQDVIDANNKIRRELPKIERDISDIVKERNRVKEANEKIKASIESLKSQIKDGERQLKENKSTSDQLKEQHTEKTALLATNKGAIAQLVDPDLSVFSAKIEQVETINKNVSTKKQLATITKDMEAKLAEADSLTAKIAEIDKEKEDALKAAKFPIECLGFDDDGVTYKGIPFSQCSSAERLRVSISIAMAMAPELRVIRITDGSLIDSKNMAIIEEMCKEKDYQCWIEKVDESGKIGIYIEDGEIKQ